MKKLIALGILTSTMAFADESAGEIAWAPAVQEAHEETVKVSEGYVSLGLGPFPLPLPFFGLGGRFQSGHHGFDVSAQVATVVSLTALKENFLYLHYFKPNLASQFYVGGGVGVTEIFSRHDFGMTLSPQFIFGKEYTNEAGDRRFFQAQIDWPFFELNAKHGDRVGKFPAVVVSYGICF